jgi:hypothetical protein
MSYNRLLLSIYLFIVGGFYVNCFALRVSDPLFVQSTTLASPKAEYEARYVQRESTNKFISIIVGKDTMSHYWIRLEQTTMQPFEWRYFEPNSFQGFVSNWPKLSLLYFYRDENGSDKLCKFESSLLETPECVNIRLQSSLTISGEYEIGSNKDRLYISELKFLNVLIYLCFSISGEQHSPARCF